MLWALTRIIIIIIIIIISDIEVLTANRTPLDSLI
jgi:hypothetical protein